MSLFGSIKNVVTKSLDTVSGVFQNPITAVTKGPAAATQKFLNDNLTSRIVKTVVTTGAVASTVIGAGAAAAAGTAATVKAVVTTAAKNKLATGAALVAVPLIVKSEKAQQIVEDLPSKVANVGGDVGKVIDNPNIGTAKQFVENHPIATATAALAGGIALGKTVLPLVNGYLNYSNTQAVKDNTESVLEATTHLTSSGNYSILPFIPQQTSVPTSAVVAPFEAAPAELIKPVKKKVTKKKNKAVKKKKKTRRSKKKKKVTKKKNKKTIKRKASKK